jgi:multicomponent Na+:H+ antiporter subunit C
VITGLVVAFAATALAVALLLRLVEETGQATVDHELSSNAAPAPGTDS